MASLLHISIFFLLTILVIAHIPMTTSRTAPTGGGTLMLERFERWIIEHGRRYENEAEKAARFDVFKSKVEYIDSFNSNGTHSFELGTNQFTDRTDEELNAMLMKEPPPPPSSRLSTRFRYENVTDAPASMDWRTKGAVTEAKAQGTCGACWVFAAVATVESIIQIKTGKLLSLSEQQIIDCTSGDACQGGVAHDAYDYIVGNKGLALEETYPYVKHDNDACDAAKAHAVAATITGIGYVPGDNEEALMRAVANQPVFAVMSAGSDEFGSYRGDGVFNGNCGSFWHAVAVIGYGVQPDGTKYWLVKNPWGDWWGNGGIGKIAREVGIPRGVCSIAGWPAYPTLD